MKNVKIFIMLFITLLLSGCINKDTGKIAFYANGEDFIREGFVSKDGWNLEFKHVYVTLNNIKSYQKTKNNSEKIKSKAVLQEFYTVDLAEGDENASLIFIDEAEKVNTGYYNSIEWQLVNNENGEYNGYSVVLIGTALKNNEKINFKIMLSEEYEYSCGAYIGDKRKGFVKKDGAGEQEITFHFDHIFGDGSIDIDDDLNKEAPGFNIFYKFTKDGVINIDSKKLKNDLYENEYAKLHNALITLGHVGEGHCHSEIIKE